MTPATDTFAAFLDTLAETLDLGSHERARRLHLSRFHLDHVLTFAAVRRLVVLGAYETLGITDLDAGDPALWVAEPTA